MNLASDRPTIIIERIAAGLRDIFPDADGLAITAETRLGELPEWDSMAAVNLQTYLKEQFDRDVPLELLSDDTTLEEITAFLEEASNREAV